MSLASPVADEIGAQIHNQYERAVIRYYRDCVRDEMLGRIVCFGSDPSFVACCGALSEDLGVPIVEASKLLWPASHAIYVAADGARDG